MQQWDRIWTDGALRDKYGITANEWSYIESQVRAMSLGDGSEE